MFTQTVRPRSTQGVMFNVFRSIMGFATQPRPGGPQTLHDRVRIARPNPHPQARAVALLRGFDIEFTNGDHPLWQLEIQPRIEGFSPTAEEIDFFVEVGVRDSSGNWDDSFRGGVSYQIVVIDDPEVFSQTDTISLASTAPGQGPLRGRGHFSQQVPPQFLSVALLSGFSIRYIQKEHNVLEMGVEVHMESAPAGAEELRSVSAALRLRDSSGTFDDPYGGTVSYAMLTFPPDRVFHDVAQFGFLGKADFPVVTSGRGPFTQESEIVWNAVVPFQQIIVAPLGFRLAFTNGDHFFGRGLSRLEHQIPAPGTSPTRLHLIYEGGLRDMSGEWDDPYTVEANYHLIGAAQPALSGIDNAPATRA